jgi:hypothetical protein
MASSDNKAGVKLQFLLTENQLKDIYSSINYTVGAYTDRTQMVLSKPEKKKVKLEEIYDDCYSLSLTKSEISMILEEISHDGHRSRVPGLITHNLERGLMER